MVELSRTVRFTIRTDDDAHGAGGYAATPTLVGLGAMHEMTVTVRGEPDETTGYLLDIKTVDQAVRTAAAPVIQHAFASARHTEPASLLAGILRPLSDALPATAVRVLWRLTPYYSLEMSPDAPTTVAIRQRFEFAASHRLHVPSLSDEENRRLFGKCNNPNGHGHNYVLEPCVEVTASGTAPAFTLTDLERIVDETIIDRFDHKHLNVDTEEFGEGGLSPSAEHIARVCHDLLAPRIAAAGATLRSVTLWETDRTSATYPTP